MVISKPVYYFRWHLPSSTPPMMMIQTALPLLRAMKYHAGDFRPTGKDANPSKGIKQHVKLQN